VINPNVLQVDDDDPGRDVYVYKKKRSHHIILFFSQYVPEPYYQYICKLIFEQKEMPGEGILPEEDQVLHIQYYKFFGDIQYMHIASSGDLNRDLVHRLPMDLTDFQQGYIL
jgi:hypothetical protein